MIEYVAGLRLAPGGTQMTRTWIVYNKPKEPSYTHAGMLMGLGLTGEGFWSTAFGICWQQEDSYLIRTGSCCAVDT